MPEDEAMAQAKKSVSRPRGAKNNPQLKKDPAFMATLEKALRSEQKKAMAAHALAAPQKQQSAAGAEKPTSVSPPRDSAAATEKRQLTAAAKPKVAGTPRKSAAGTSRKPVAPTTNQRVEAAAVCKQQKALAAELEGLIPQLDCEGLAFLIEQARVHLYNMKVTELEAAAVAAEAASSRAADTANAAARGRRGRSGSGTATPGASSAKSAASAKQAASALRIEATPGSSVFHIVWQDKWKMFGEAEIMALLKICRAASDAAEAGPRLYRWLHKERGDFFQEVPVSGPADPLLAALYTLLTKTFTIKQ